MGVPAPLIPEGSLLNSSAPRVAIALAQAIALMMSVAFINRRAIPAVPALLSGGRPHAGLAPVRAESNEERVIGVVLVDLALLLLPSA